MNQQMDNIKMKNKNIDNKNINNINIKIKNKANKNLRNSKIIKRVCAIAFAFTILTTSVFTHRGLNSNKVLALDNGLALTPPMGWSSWNCFGGDINEAKIKEIADAMISSGMKDAGYEYINIDDMWMANPARDNNGVLRADPTRFPGGIKAIADYLHERGLKLGIYGDRGSATCCNVPMSGSYGYEELDAKTFASWGVDYLKYDNCNIVGNDLEGDYRKMSDALRNSGRPIVFSICCWYFPGPWVVECGNLWRTTSDIADNWSSMIGIAEINNKSAAYAGPGHWNDPDMMEVGNGGMTTTEYKTHFSLWSIMAAPLIAGNDLRKMDQETIDILTNKEVIAVDQDPAGIQGRKISANGDLEIWCKPLGTDGTTKAILLLNKGNSAADITVKWSDVRLKDSGVTVRDLWEHKDLGTFNTGFTAKAVPSHGSVMIKVKGESIYPAPPAGAVYLSDMEWTKAENGWGPVEKDMSAGGGNEKDGVPISIKGNSYAKGLGCQAPAQVVYNLDGQYRRFVSDIGLDDDTTGAGSVVFQVFGDGEKLYDSGLIKSTSPIQTIDIDITGVKELKLVVADGGDGTNNDHGDWAGAYVVKDGELPTSKFEFNSNIKFSATSLIPNSTVTVNASVTSNSSVAYSGTKDVLLVVGLYDKNNTLLSMATKTSAIAYGKTQSLSAEIKLPDNVEGFKVRTFLWDGKDIKSSKMIPLSDVSELK